MSIQQNYAKFESRVDSSAAAASPVSNVYEEGGMYNVVGSQSSYYDGGGYGGRALDLISALWILVSIAAVIVGILYGLYLLLTLIKHGVDAVLKELQTRAKWARSGVSAVWNWFISRRIRHVFKAGWKNILFWVAVLVIGSALTAMVQGRSNILRVTSIPQGSVGVDLKNDALIQPGYHVYSPLMSSYFLSPTNTFDFEIAEVTASTVEDLSVSLDWRVGFEFSTDAQRLAFYNQYGPKDIRSVSSDIVMPLLLESIKTVIQRYSFRDLSSQSDSVKQEAFDLATAKLQEKGIALQYLNIIDIRLPQSYLDSQQDLLKAENEGKLAEAALETQKKQAETDLLKAENDKNVKIVEAQAIAEYNAIVSEQQLSNQAIEMRKLDIEAMKIEKWDGSLPSTVEGGLPF